MNSEALNEAISSISFDPPSDVLKALIGNISDQLNETMPACLDRHLRIHRKMIGFTSGKNKENWKGGRTSNYFGEENYDVVSVFHKNCVRENTIMIRKFDGYNAAYAFLFRNGKKQ